jgi:hypothetical protein
MHELVGKIRRQPRLAAAIGAVLLGLILAIANSLSGSADDDAVNAVRDRLKQCGLADAVLDVSKARADGRNTDGDLIVAIPFQPAGGAAYEETHVSVFHDDKDGWVINGDLPAYECWGTAQ